MVDYLLIIFVSITVSSVTEIGEHIIHFEQLPSTNVYAAELLSKTRPVEGTVITTDYQYAGRGQMTNIWESAPYKNVSLSAILYPTFLKVADQFTFNKAISIAVFQTIVLYSSDKVSIKWPNDIYINNHKVAGILIQNQIQGKYISTSIVGVGINVNQETFISDARNPISIYNSVGKYIDLNNFRKALFENLTRQYQALRLGANRQLNDIYHDLLYQKDQLCRYQIKDGAKVSGSISGVNDQGLLKVLIDGQIHEFGFKEIKYL